MGWFAISALRGALGLLLVGFFLRKSKFSGRNRFLPLNSEARLQVPHKGHNAALGEKLIRQCNDTRPALLLIALYGGFGTELAGNPSGRVRVRLVAYPSW
jgi:hypothetical protein